MKITVVMPNFNGGRFIEEAIRSVLRQKAEGAEVELLVLDGGSTDHSLEILRTYEPDIDAVVSEPDRGPASAINKGLRRASGEVLAWLNSDDRYHPGTLRRVAECFEQHPGAALCFGPCRIVDEQGVEIRKGITRFKEFFFPLASRFTIQSINFVSQPAMFFRRAAFEEAGPLREDLVAAWDYDLVLRLWQRGGSARIGTPALADFRWHPTSISGQQFGIQFQEEYEAAVRDAGRLSPQALLHLGVRWGIVFSYGLMAKYRRLKSPPAVSDPNGI